MIVINAEVHWESSISDKTLDSTAFTLIFSIFLTLNLT